MIDYKIALLENEYDSTILPDTIYDNAVIPQVFGGCYIEYEISDGITSTRFLLVKHIVVDRYNEPVLVCVRVLT